MATRRSSRSRKAVTRFNPDSAATKSKPRARTTTATTAAASSTPGAGRKAKPTKRSSTKESKPKPRRKRERSATPEPTKRTGSGLLFVFAHGAGASSQSDWMQEWAARLATVGTVHAFDYPYMKNGGRPPRAEKTIDNHKAEVDAAVANFTRNNGHAPASVVLIGKSMGSRIGCHVAVEYPDCADAVVCLGYPLVGMNKKLRDEVLKALRVPTLLVQGTRDRMSPEAELKRALSSCSKTGGFVTSHVVETGDHSLKTTVAYRKKAGGVSQSDVYDGVLEKIMEFLATNGIQAGKPQPRPAPSGGAGGGAGAVGVGGGAASASTSSSDSSQGGARPTKRSRTAGGASSGLLFVFAHGARASSQSDWMQEWAARLATVGTVHAFDYPYMKNGGRPPRAEKNIDNHKAEVDAAVANFTRDNGHAPASVVLIGKSMGSRIGCHVAVEYPDCADAVVCLGYPLVGMNKKLRDEVLKALRVPTLLVQGTRDRMSPEAELKRALSSCSKTGGFVTSHVVETGDHSLKTTVTYRKKAGGVSQSDVYDGVLEKIMEFLRSHGIGV